MLKFKQSSRQDDVHDAKLKWNQLKKKRSIKMFFSVKKGLFKIAINVSCQNKFMLHSIVFFHIDTF